MSRRRNYQYSEVPQEPEQGGGDDDSSKIGDDFTDAQFTIPPKKVPYKAIALAFFLCIFGTISLVIGIMIAGGFIHEKYLDRMWPLFMIGSIMFVPGFYHVRIVVYTYLRRPGFSYDDIPEF